MSALLTSSDISAGLVGAGYAALYRNTGIGKQAITSLAVSIVARMTSAQLSMFSSMNMKAKNALIVSILYAVLGAIMRQDIAKTVISGLSIDLIGEAVLSLLDQNDSDWVGQPWSSAPGAAVQVVTPSAQIAAPIRRPNVVVTSPGGFPINATNATYATM